MSKIACEYRNNYPHGMSYFRCQYSNPHFWQGVISKSHADQKGLQYCYQINEHEEYRRFMY